ncbi:MAG: hypothetical protein QOJ24_1185 [Mycobacterium sp.]|jgi:hypothetical protein|nr:hypothetical protein [Mycobacterium sp.]
MAQILSTVMAKSATIEKSMPGRATMTGVRPDKRGRV